ncbi:Positive regulator of CheA protein activity (CheW) [hydrothermal vent metagenome]|uniref:Positive regulator of CheA protein activity (CheW) n=1 Tax=hydrothermal vent metagenome TaxID=652676 RepID=A0A3B0Y881_9ZZZZ
MAQVAEQGCAEVSPNADQSQFLTFTLGDEVYAIEILNIREIIDYGNLTTVPMMPAFIRGVINLRGSVVPVVDLAARFDGEPAKITKRTSIIIIEIVDGEATMNIGAVVDGVNEVLDIPPGDIEPAPSFGTRIRTDFIKGMGKIDGKFLVLLNVANVLSVDELSLLDEVQQQARVETETALPELAGEGA